MDPENSIPGKVPQRPARPNDASEAAERAPHVEPPLPDPPREDGLVQLLRRVPMYAFIVFLGIVAADAVFPGVNVVVRNDGPGTMRDVSIRVKDDIRPLEPLVEGATGNARFRLWGDAHVSIDYTDDDGKPQRLDAGQHRFSSMAGTILVQVRKGRAFVDTSVRPAPKK